MLESSKVNKYEEKVAKRVAKTAEEKIVKGWKRNTLFRDWREAENTLNRKIFCNQSILPKLWLQLHWHHANKSQEIAACHHSYQQKHQRLSAENENAGTTRLIELSAYHSHQIKINTKLKKITTD